MADKSFGVKDINLIGASGTPTIDSPNNLNINAVNVAISTDITVGGKVSLGAGTSISSPAANTLTLGTNSVERIRIDSSGRIGVGVVPTAQFAHNLIQIGNQCTLGANASLSATGQTFLTHNLYFDTSGNFQVFNTSNANEGAILRLVDGQLRFSNSDATTGTPTVTERLRIASNGQVSISNDGTTDGLLTIKGNSDEVSTPSIRLLDGTDTREVSITNTSGDFVVSTHGTDDAIHGRIKIFESGVIDIDNGGSSGTLTNRLRISSSGSIGIGINNPQDYHASANSLVTSSGITLANTSQGSIYFADSSTGTGEYVGQINYYHSNNQLSFVTNNTEHMRLSGNGEHMVYSQGTVSALRTAASSSGSAEILYCTRNSSSVTVGTGVYAIYSNGSASSLSDRTQKKNIETTRDGYLEDLNRLRVVKYNWNDQEDGTPKELGLIAQEVEEVFPGLISDMRSDVGIGTTASTKGVKTSVLPYMLLKALQEANAEIVALKARVNTLEGS